MIRDVIETYVLELPVYLVAVLIVHDMKPNQSLADVQKLFTSCSGIELPMEKIHNAQAALTRQGLLKKTGHNSHSATNTGRLVVLKIRMSLQDKHIANVIRHLGR